MAGLSPWRDHGSHDDITGNLAVTHGERLRANWPALLLPLVAVGTLGLFSNRVPILVVIVSVALFFAAPRASAWLAPYALLAYGGYGLFLFHSLNLWESPPVVYGVVRAATNDNAAYVLGQAIVFLAAGVLLLARTDGPGGGAVRRALAQLRGTDGQPKTVPPLLLLPVLFLWEELFSNQLWFDWSHEVAAPLFGLLLAMTAVVLVRWRPRAAAALAVAGLLTLGLYGVIDGAWHLTSGTQEWLAGSNNYGRWLWGLSYGAVPLNTGPARLAALLQGIALLGAGCALAPRLVTWSGDLELARRAQALTQRVTAHPDAQRRDRGSGGRTAPDRT